MKKLLVGVFAWMLLTSCQTTGGALEEGAMTFTRGELYAYLAEHTQVVGEAGIFYSEEGFFETIVDGERIKGDWVTRDEGTVCREVSGQKDACETYYHNGDVVSIVTSEQTSLAPNLVEGNTVVVKELYTKEQTLELVAGKTVVWDPNGGGYYAPDGRLYTLWDGERETGNWTVNDEGGVCWSVPGWGSTPCEYYYMGDDGLTAVYKGQDSSASEHQEGNTLDSL